LITYSSITGNTEKVALRFKETFEKRGWQCDIFKVRKRAEDILRPPFDIRSYDFICDGSGLSAHARTETLKWLIDGGWADRLLPSHDFGLATPLTFYPPDVKESNEKGNPYGYLYIKKVVFTQLREMGVDEAVLNTLCVNGPKNFFEGA
jgi:hypothetical protein